MLENITPTVKIRRRLQSDQGQNASHDHTCSTTGLPFVRLKKSDQTCSQELKRQFQFFFKTLPSENGIDSECNSCIFAKQAFVWGKTFVYLHKLDCPAGFFRIFSQMQGVYEVFT